jgi:ParB-like chromosome segregation protein Spo0J
MQNLIVGPPNNAGMHKLVCGERRFAGAKQAELYDLMCLVLESDDYLLHRELELEENVRRENLHYHEVRAAVTEYHQLKTAESEADQTGKAMGLAQNSVSDYLGMSTEMGFANPEDRERLLKAPDVKTAVKKPSFFGMPGYG